MTVFRVIYTTKSKIERFGLNVLDILAGKLHIYSTGLLVAALEILTYTSINYRIYSPS